MVSGKSIVHGPCTAGVLAALKNLLSPTTTTVFNFKYLSSKVETLKKADFIAYLKKKFYDSVLAHGHLVAAPVVQGPCTILLPDTIVGTAVHPWRLLMPRPMIDKTKI